MALAKFYEDIVDDFTDKVPVGYTPIIIPHTPTELTGVKFLDCIYSTCEAQFRTYAELQSHLLNYHNIQFYVKIDEIIADEITIYNSLPKKIQLNNNSTNDVIDYEIYFNGNSLIINSIAPASYYNIKKVDIREGKYEIVIKQLHKSIFIYVKKVPDFISEDIDPIINKYIDRYQLNKKWPDLDDSAWDIFWQEFLEEINKIKDFFKQKYLKGFYEYLLGLYLEESNNELAKEHYEYSFSHLRLYNVRLAVTIMRALAFKMNLFGLLKNSSIKSIFHGSNLFFNNTYDQLVLVLSSQKYEGMFEEEILHDIILLDVKNSLLLKIIHAYLKGEYKQSDDLVEQIKKINKSVTEDILFDIKFNIILARLSRVQGKNEEAKKFYRELNFYLEETNILKNEINDFLKR